MRRRVAWAVPALPVLVVVAGCGGAGASRAGGRGTPRDPSVAAGTQVELRSQDTINSRYNHVGDPVMAAAVRAVRDAAGDTVIPAGAEFSGTVTSIASAPNPRSLGTLAVTFSTARFGGRTYPVHLRVTSLATEMHGRGITGGTAAKVGAGAVVGGIAGRLIGGNATGTVVGAAAGGAAGGVYAHETRTLDIMLPKGGLIRAVLTQPFARGVAER